MSWNPWPRPRHRTLPPFKVSNSWVAGPELGWMVAVVLCFFTGKDATTGAS